MGSEAQNYDVIIVGGAVIGSSIAWHLTGRDDFKGRVLVIEKDPNYEFCSTALSAASIRQQFSTRSILKCRVMALIFCAI